MKKILALCAVALLAIGSVAAQSSENSSASTASVEEQYVDISTSFQQIEDKYAEFHPTAKHVSITLEYTPLTGEVVVYYSCIAASYDQGEAIDTIDAVLTDFAREHKFTTRAKQFKKDKTTYSKEGQIKMAKHRRWVRFDNK